VVAAACATLRHSAATTTDTQPGDEEPVTSSRSGPPQNAAAREITARQIAVEQAYLDDALERLATERAEAERQLDTIRRRGTTGTPGSVAEHNALYANAARRRARLDAVEERLCFGRLDMADGTRHHVGRIGLSDAAGRRILLDWRAPLVEPFYRATAARPDGVVRRRHIATQRRTVTGLDDEVLDLDAAGDTETVTGDGALMLALTAVRTGRMRDIVATIQAEQDQVIRAALPGVMIVQGGPGTGKTVVALHRVAYLLYTHRERLGRSGVLLVGPNPAFLRYIEQVLPTLGESSVVTTTVDRMYPGVEVSDVDEPGAAEVKGHLAMASVIAAAVRGRQRVPDGTRTMDVDGTPLRLHPHDVRAAAARANATRLPHNQARVVFVVDLLDRLAARLARRLGITADRATRSELLADLRAARDVRREVNWCWPPVLPQKLLRDLYADHGTATAAGMSARQWDAVRRRRAHGWTTADVALLDEAADLLGEDDSVRVAEARRAETERQAERAYARSVMSGAGPAAKMITAGELADRYAGAGEARARVQDAAADRGWGYGHVVVDEAQELSAMQWRMVMRRCPTRSMTVVGDPAQTGTPAGATSWAQALTPIVGTRWREHALTVNYRTPGRVMAAAVAVLAGAGIEVRPPSSARDGDPPAVERIDGSLDEAVLRAVREEVAEPDVGQLAVICSPHRAATFAGLPLAVGAPTVVSVLTPAQAKGLEFDVVVLVEPADIVAAHPRGINDLYVAMTRPTTRLRVLHARPLPAGLPCPE
jgi:DNA helicase IV